MRLLELFSGTHSVGKIATKKGYEVYSLDRDMGPRNDDYTSTNHFREDILTWNYKQFTEGYFDIITASPVCLFWSVLRNTWIGRRSKSINPDGTIVIKADIQRDIELLGKPMVDKIFEILEYFSPKYWWIENPKTSKMKDYISERWSDYNYFYDVDYCMYSDWGYKKGTRFWTNITNFVPKTCDQKCGNMLNNSKRHKKSVDGGGNRDNNNGMGSVKLERYRIPPKLIEDLLDGCDT